VSGSPFRTPCRVARKRSAESGSVASTTTPGSIVRWDGDVLTDFVRAPREGPRHGLPRRGNWRQITRTCRSPDALP
jgi:hypothetical protein